MSCIVFYEKPGCATNHRQKQLLRSAGLELEVRNLLSESWTTESLRPFFGNLPVSQWFNPAAPTIKHGELEPSTLDADTALALMVENPLLIRRPLIRCGQQFMAGFDQLGLNALLPRGRGKLSLLTMGLNACSRGQTAQVCL